MSVYSDPKDVPYQIDNITRERIQNYIKSQKQKCEREEISSHKVNKELCNLINEIEGDIPVKSKNEKDMLDILPVKSHSTIYYHLRGDCTHENRQRVTYDECGWMRFYAYKGAPTRTLSLLFDVSKKHIRKHLKGECNHNNSFGVLTGKEIRENSWKEAKVVTSICPHCKEEFKHKEYNDQRFCSNLCNGRYAGSKGAQAVNSD